MSSNVRTADSRISDQEWRTSSYQRHRPLQQHGILTLSRSVGNLASFIWDASQRSAGAAHCVLPMQQLSAISEEVA